MPRFSIPALFLAAAHLVAAVSLPSNGTSVTVTVGFVRQRDAPVQIVELRRPDERSQNPLLHLVNKTCSGALLPAKQRTAQTLRDRAASFTRRKTRPIARNEMNA